MARHNIVFLYAQVAKSPKIVLDAEGNPTYAMVYVNVVRGNREVGDKLKYLKTDHPLIMTKEPAILDAISEWKENDIVSIKGTVASRNIKKSSFCPNCSEKNSFDGCLVYVNPIYVEKRGHFDTKTECLEELSDKREISNQVYILGTLVREPKKIKTKSKLTITQYQIALNRKYKIRTDDPEIRTDYPWVKSYGENAVEDKMRLHTGSVIFVDGLLQARTVHRKVKCPHCEKSYVWDDKAMEIVPYEAEYMPGTFYTDEEIEEQNRIKVEEYKKMLFGEDTQDELDEDMSTED